MHVFEILLRLRQVCDHVFLVMTRADVTSVEDVEKTLV